LCAIQTNAERELNFKVVSFFDRKILGLNQRQLSEIKCG